MPTFSRANGPRGADIAFLGHESVVRALAVERANRVDRWEVHGVKAHSGHARQRFHGCGKCAVDRVPVLVPPAGGAREELIPGAKESLSPFDVHLTLRPLRHQLAQGVGGEGGRNIVSKRWRETIPQGGLGHQSLGRGTQKGTVRGVLRSAVEKLRTMDQVIVHLCRGLASGGLLGHGIAPGGNGIRPRLNPESPQPGGVRSEHSVAVVRTVVLRSHGETKRAPIGGSDHDCGRNRIMSFAPYKRRDRHNLPNHCFGGQGTVGGAGPYVIDSKSANRHCCHLVRFGVAVVPLVGNASAQSAPSLAEDGAPSRGTERRKNAPQWWA